MEDPPRHGSGEMASVSWRKGYSLASHCRTGPRHSVGQRDGICLD